MKTLVLASSLNLAPLEVEPPTNPSQVEPGNEKITAASNVPEPSYTVGLLALGILGSGVMLKRKLKNQNILHHWR